MIHDGHVLAPIGQKAGPAAAGDSCREGTVMKIVLRVVGPLFVAVGLFCFAQGTGLLTWPHNAAMVDYGAGIAAAGFGLVWFGWQ